MNISTKSERSEGNKHCCYGTCNTDTRYRDREDMDGVFFIPFPKPITRMETCEKWIKACGRTNEDFNINSIKRSTYLCSKHFVGGKGPTEKNPDPIPALLHTDEQVIFLCLCHVFRGPLPLKLSRSAPVLIVVHVISLGHMGIICK